MTSYHAPPIFPPLAHVLPLAVAVVLSAGAVPTVAQQPDPASGADGGPPPGSAAELTLGRIDFPVTSSNEDARREFELGVLALHSFWYREAVEDFRRARELEPGLAMAYWGEAMAQDRPFWRLPPDRGEPRDGRDAGADGGADRHRRAAGIRPRVGQGLPHILFPMPREVRGSVLLATGRPEAALSDFEAVLEEAPHRPRSLLGAARSADAAGDVSLAADHYRELLGVWSEADPGLPAAGEARRYLEGGRGAGSGARRGW